VLGSGPVLEDEAAVLTSITPLLSPLLSGAPEPDSS
jgi:hypothetical protein